MIEGELSWTGHPFVDTGLATILILSGKTHPQQLTKEDINRAIEFVSELYAKDEWSKFIQGQVLPNSGILLANPSSKRKRTPKNIRQKLQSISEKIPPISDEQPTCTICGRRKALKDESISRVIGRAVIPMTGSSNMRNFFPSANEHGIDICATCILLIQFVPIGSYKIGNVLTVHAYPPKYHLELVKDAVKNARESSVLSSDFKLPENFLFHLIEKTVRNIEYSWKESVSVTAYYYQCYNQGQKLKIIKFPSNVLRFIAYASAVDSQGWKKITATGWKTRNKKIEELEKSKRNEVYTKLLNGESILAYFYNSAQKATNATWELLEFYAREVLNLNAETLNLARNIADKVIETLSREEDNKVKRIIRELEQAERLFEFEAFFLYVEKYRQKLGIQGALMSFEEFASLLTSYGIDIDISWKTVKNLMLFRIYEQMHDRLVKEEQENQKGSDEQ